MDQTPSHEDRENNSARKSRKTRSRRHVELQRERPHLTREAEEADPSASAPQKNASNGNRQPTKKRQAQGKAQPSSKEPDENIFASPKKDPHAVLKIIPLGGLDGIGKNMTVLECAGDMVLDDAGLMFPEDDHPGIDLILPDYTYVLENASRLRGIVITHGHEDHTGALPYLLKDLDIPVKIYGTKLTLGLIKGKLAEHKVTNAKLCEITAGQPTIKLGCFSIDFFAVNHSIPGSVGIFFQSPAGNVLHTGDFKLDQTPIDGVHTDFAAITRFSKIGVDLLMSDSTNAQNVHFTPSEAEVGKTLQKIISQAKQKVIIASFASHIHRMQQICDAAVANGRKVVVTGRSMIQNTDIARTLGYLTIKDTDLIDAYEIKGTPPDKIVVMCTGSQG
ncbi:MAG: ribonuclease J, partial [Eggerthellaceae bacterium]|nr:ribonuclease J [Eggerthellaceae bacterium]